MSKKRKFSEDFIKYEFTCLIEKEVERPQCVICDQVLSTESMKPGKLQRHLCSKHPKLANNDVTYFKQQEAKLKRLRLDKVQNFSSVPNSAVEASYVVSRSIVFLKKAHTDGENFLNQTWLKDLDLPCFLLSSGKFLFMYANLNRFSK